MTWVKIDDGIFDNPKVAVLSNDAKVAYLKSITYCARVLSDGMVPFAMAREYAGSKTKVMQEVFNAGLWERMETELQVHDYLQYNPTRAQVLAEREAAKARMQGVRSGDVRANNKRTSKRSSASPVSRSPNPESHSPVPEPEPSERARTFEVSTAPPFPDPEPESLYIAPFTRSYVKHYEQREARPPSPIEQAAARLLERDFGADECIAVAEAHDWLKHPNYLRPILEERKNGNANRTNRGKSAATHDSEGVADGVQRLDKHESVFARRRRASVS